jgi:hypothetical protein
MLFGGGITTPIIVSIPPTLYAITVFAKLESLTGNDKDVYYKINAGSWTFLTTITSTGCADWADIPGLVNGDVVLICAEDTVTGGFKNFWGIDNSSACATSGGGGAEYAEDSAGTCGAPMIVNMTAAFRNVALWIRDSNLCV